MRLDAAAILCVNPVCLGRVAGSVTPTVPTVPRRAPPLQVHLALDTSGAGGHMSVRAFVSRALGIGGRELARELLEVDCEVRGGEAERVSIDLLR